MTIPLPKYFNANKSLYFYKISCANFLLQHTCQMFCSLAKAIAVTAVIVLGSCEFCQVRIMNMQNKGEIWPIFLSSLSMFSICQLRLKEKKKEKKEKQTKRKNSYCILKGRWDSSEVPWGVVSPSSKPHM